MNILDIIAKKRDKGILNKEEIEYFVKEYTKGTITDYQAAALIMAIYINGMNENEITNLTLAMAYSGEIVDLSKFGNNVVDKHSTGGVGDKVSIALLPIIASLGVPVAKMSGRGLGFTGGTVDKFEAIPNYKTEFTMEEFIKNVEKTGISMISQSLDIAPADKKIYALRDTISCVDSIPLIASSIMSKKIANGANKIVLDVTVGLGAFMKNIKQAQELATEMLKIGKLSNRETICIFTNMNEPLGYAVGNTLEMIEAVKFLRGEETPEDLKEVVLELGSYMLKLAGKGDNLQENKQRMLENIRNQKAYNKFLQMVSNQGGDISYIEDLSKLEKAKYIVPVYSICDGYIEEINAEDIGKLACYLGAGRLKKEDSIQVSVGLVLNKKISDIVKKGDVLAYVHSNDEKNLQYATDRILDIFKISEAEIEKPKILLGIM